MCWCTPNLRTPCCGKEECVPPIRGGCKHGRSWSVVCAKCDEEESGYVAKVIADPAEASWITDQVLHDARRAYYLSVERSAANHDIPAGSAVARATAAMRAVIEAASVLHDARRAYYLSVGQLRARIKALEGEIADAWWKLGHSYADRYSTLSEAMESAAKVIKEAGDMLAAPRGYNEGFQAGRQHGEAMVRLNRRATDMWKARAEAAEQAQRDVEREAFRAGFSVHPDKSAPSGWSFDLSTCAASDMEPVAWDAYRKEQDLLEVKPSDGGE